MKKNNIILFSVLGVLALTLLGFGIYYTTTQSDNQFFAFVKGSYAPIVEKEPNLTEADLIYSDYDCRSMLASRIRLFTESLGPIQNPQEWDKRQEKVYEYIQEIIVDEVRSEKYIEGMSRILLDENLPPAVLNELPDSPDDFEILNFNLSFNKEKSDSNSTVGKIDYFIEGDQKVPNALDLDKGQIFYVLRPDIDMKLYFDYDLEIEHDNLSIASTGEIVLVFDKGKGEYFVYLAKSKPVNLAIPINIRERDFILEPSLVYSHVPLEDELVEEIPIWIDPDFFEFQISPNQSVHEEMNQGQFIYSIRNPFSNTTNTLHPNYKKINDLTNQIMYETVIDQMVYWNKAILGHDIVMTNFDPDAYSGYGAFTVCIGPFKVDAGYDQQMQGSLRPPEPTGLINCKDGICSAYEKSVGACPDECSEYYIDQQIDNQQIKK